MEPEYGGLIISYPIYKYSNTVSLAITLMIINLFIASIIAVEFYYLFLWIKKVLRSCNSLTFAIWLMYYIFNL
jgi:hypothetical protein